MKTNKTVPIAFVVVFLTFRLAAQIHNTGAMYISPKAEVSMYSKVTNTSNGKITNNGRLYVHRSLTNNGVINFTPTANSGATIFTGSVEQEITGSGNTRFYDVSVENSGADASVVLDKEIGIYGKANFTDGILAETANGLLVFTPTTEHQNTSDASFVLGKVVKKGSEAFTFPIGGHKDGTYYYRPAGISTPDAATDAFTAGYFWENSSSLYPHSQKEEAIDFIDDTEYWVIENTEGNSTPEVTLSWHMATTPLKLVANDASNLVVVRWNGTQWVNEGGTVDVLENSITATVTGYGVFTLAATLEKENSLLFPTAFSPNGDGVHDTFVISGAEKQYPSFELEIVNRWGSRVYSYKNKGVAAPIWWDGTSKQQSLVLGKGKKLPVGTYFYIFKYNKSGKSPKTGYVYLNR